MPNRRFPLAAVLTAFAIFVPLGSRKAGAADGTSAGPAQRPNVVIILSDDVGFGDLGCYGARLVKTPNLDRLAAQGLRFTDGHASASTCTPSRYSLITGQYAWRKPGTNILPGDANLLITPGSTTLPEVMHRAGYVSGCVGKWHLGLGEGEIDWNGNIAPGPIEIGFDYSFIVPATPDRVPCVYVEGHKVVGLDPNDPIKVSYQHKVGNDPTGLEDAELLVKMKADHQHSDTIVDGISRIGWMAGGHSARWVDEEMAKTLTKKATDFIDENKNRPFFLYFATNDIHVPRAPNKQFVGTSGCGVRGDAIEELDWSVGQVMETLQRLHLDQNTLVIFSSDNGPVIDDGYADGSVEHLNGHTPAGPYRGGKYTIWEGGTRMPFITWWPGHIKPGVSNALVSQVDFVASFASFLNQPLGPDGGPDSFNVMPAFLGQSPDGRKTFVEQSEKRIALREGDWKFIPSAGQAKMPGKGPPHRALFDVAKDPSESKNVAAQHPDVAKQMEDRLKKIEQDGRSRPQE